MDLIKAELAPLLRRAETALALPGSLSSNRQPASSSGSLRPILLTMSERNSPTAGTPLTGSGGALGYMPQLDGLRAIAVGMVLFYHWIRIHLWVNLGHLGVTLFFVLSGFLITEILLKIKEQSSQA